MKKLILALVCLAAYSICAKAQTNNASKSLDTSTVAKTIEAGWGTLNYSVPESPAFKILGTSPSSIMRPTSTRNIAFSIGNYFLNNGATIPQNLAVEISPALFDPHLSLTKFRQNRFWYTSALSVGTKVNTDKSYAIAVGVKFKLLDEQDLRMNDVLIKKFDEYGPNLVNAFANAVKTVTRQLKANDPTNTVDFPTYSQNVADAYRDTANAKHAMIKKLIDAEINSSFDVTKISKFRDSIKKANWNKPIWDLGFASLFNSKDSLLRNIKAFSKIGLWTTFGAPLGAKGQLLIGLSAQLKDSLSRSLNIGTLNIGSRAYYGSNDLKGFIEANANIETHQSGIYKASLGIETTFFGGMWVDFSLGFSKQGGSKAVFTPGFNLLFGNPEKKNAGS